MEIQHPVFRSGMGPGWVNSPFHLEDEEHGLGEGGRWEDVSAQERQWEMLVHVEVWLS